MEARTSFLLFREAVRQKLPLSLEGQSSDWRRRMKVMLGSLSISSTDVCIYEVPNELRKMNGDPYSPRIVSIGPLHEGEHNLLAMEEHKWRYTQFLLQRTENPVESFDECSEAILQLEKVRQSYAENIKFNDFELAEIMLVDGCFILELFLRFLDGPEDGIIHNERTVSDLQHDLALLENQIPFFILQKLFDIVVPRIEDKRPALTITILAFSFFYPVLNLSKEAVTNECNILGDSHSHLLDLLHKFYLPPYPNRDQDEPHVMIECGIPAQHLKGKESLRLELCVTKLFEAGIEFEKGKDEDDHLFNIVFNKDERVLTIPPLHIDETKKWLLSNLIAFEQCLGSRKQHHIASSYAILLSSLIRSPADVELLQQKGIITNNLGGTEDAFNFFQNISEVVVPNDFYFGELRNILEIESQISKCSWRKQKAILKARSHTYMVATKNSWVRYMKDLKTDYFSNPWRIMSVIAALVLLILTAMQTYYTARPYMRHQY